MAEKNHYYVKVMSQKTDKGVTYFGYYKVPTVQNDKTYYVDPISNPRSFKVVFLKDALEKMFNLKLDEKLPQLIECKRFLNKVDTDKEGNIRNDQNGKPYYVMLLMDFDIVEENKIESVSFEEMITH